MTQGFEDAPRLLAYGGKSGVELCELCAVAGQEPITKDYPVDGIVCAACGRVCLGPPDNEVGR